MGDNQITQSEIAELREMESKATTGPWTSINTPDPGNGVAVEVVLTGEDIARIPGSAMCASTDPQKCWSRSLRKARADAALIAAARNALPRLLDAYEAQAAEIERLQAVCHHRGIPQITGEWSTAPSVADIAAANYKAKTLTRELSKCHAALDAAQEDGWRTMDSAPMDGQAFLAVAHGQVRIVAYTKTSHVPITGFCLADQGAEDFDLCNPTHWRPLPAPPESGLPTRA